MSYEVKRLDDYPAILATFNADFDAATELENLITDLRTTMSAEDKPVYVIMDLLAYNISLNDLFVGTGISVKNQDDSVRSETVQKTIKSIIVTEQKILQASIKGFERFGMGKNIEAVGTLDEALRIIPNTT